MGLLRITGTLDIAQFWPVGSSDGDTAKINLKLDQKTFRFQQKPHARFVSTNVFVNAKVKGAVSRAPIDDKNNLTIRLQGIDCTELHCRPDDALVTDPTRAAFKVLNKEYRQPFGETAAAALASLLQGSGSSLLPCTVETQVDEPNDVFDTYGRLIGDLILRIGRRNVNINRWLLQQGWAFPAFYSSMSAKEITTLTADAAEGRKKGRIWTSLQKNVPEFRPELVFRRKGLVDGSADIGAITLPKIFRRQTTWWVCTQAGITRDSFAQFLARKHDELLITQEFLEEGVHAARTHSIDECLQADGINMLRPEDMVFKERTSGLFDANNKKITAW